MGKTGATGLTRIINAGGYSLKGLRAVFVHEAAFRQEVFFAAILLPVACVVDVIPAERVMLIATVMLVLIVELFNSALEAVVDRIGSDYHELSGRAKDIGSAAVLLSLILTGVSWVLILYPLVSG